MGPRQDMAEVGARAAEGSGPRPRAQPGWREPGKTGQIPANHARCRLGGPGCQ